MASSQPQQINVADLDIQQLADVRRQLEEVNFPPFSLVHCADSDIYTFTYPGIESPDQFVCPTQAGSVEIQVVPGECWRS